MDFENFCLHFVRKNLYLDDYYIRYFYNIAVTDFLVRHILIPIILLWLDFKNPCSFFYIFQYL